MRIAIIVHGRFYAFDLARELLKRGHDVTLFTNYPGTVAAKFGMPRQLVRSFVAHGLLNRIAQRLLPIALGGFLDRVASTAFGSWAARQALKQTWDVVYGFSGVSEEVFKGLEGSRTVRFLARASSHIACQRTILDEEQARSGSRIERPSDWIVKRELREYELADAIHVLGEFPYRSFVDRGTPTCKLHLLHLGVDVRAFRSSTAQMEARVQRIRAGEPIRILSVGTFCLRKGAVDFLELMSHADRRKFQFRFVGPVARDARRLRRRAGGVAEFIPKMPQAKLPEAYAAGDLFLLPTLEDGFPVVITQALAAGLPVITTSNCGAADVIEQGRNGWVTLARRPDLLAAQLRWCDAHRDQFAEMISAASASGIGRDWSYTAQEAEQTFEQVLAARVASRAGEQNAV